jgi:hypothetical protein
VRRLAVRFAVLAAAIVGAGCGDLLQEPDTGIGPVPVHIEAVAGDDQVGMAGAALAQPLRVRLLDGAGEPLVGLWIRWTATAGSGTIEPPNAFSDANGIAEATWTLGTAAGPQQVQVLVSGATPMTFEATATAP